jgi:hypothetical protein
MLRIDAGSSDRYCDGLSRRSFVQLGVAGMAGVALPSVLLAKSASAANTTSPKDTAAILIWLDGGPSHIDLYDLKPEAPSEVRGIWNRILTNVSGIDISELSPKQAKVADKFSIGGRRRSPPAGRELTSAAAETRSSSSMAGRSKIESESKTPSQLTLIPRLHPERGARSSDRVNCRAETRGGRQVGVWRCSTPVAPIRPTDSLRAVKCPIRHSIAVRS